MRKLHKNQLGDTIIEVLLSITILSFILGISYSLATRGYRNLQVAKDHMQATLYAQEQAEALRAIRDARGWDDFRTFVLSEAITPQFRLAVDGDRWQAVPSSETNTPVNGFVVHIDRAAADVTAPGITPGFQPVDNPNSFVAVVRVQWNQIGTGTPQTIELVTRLRDI